MAQKAVLVLHAKKSNLENMRRRDTGFDLQPERWRNFV